MHSESLINHNEIDLSNSDIDDDLILDKVVNRLTDFVRKQYCGYLEKLLIQNYKNWCMQTLGTEENPPDIWIKECIKSYEENAIKSCMIVQFYRQTMLKMMSQIRKFTMNGKLADKVKLYSETSYVKYVNVGIQTNDLLQDSWIDTTYHKSTKNLESKEIDNSTIKRHEKELSLDQKINCFKKRFCNDSSDNFIKKRVRCTKECNYKKKIGSSKMITTAKDFNALDSASQIQDKPQEIEQNNYIDIEKQLEEIFENKEDDIAKELDKMFQEERTEIDELFGSSNSIEDPEISNILKEIEHSTLPVSAKVKDFKEDSDAGRNVRIKKVNIEKEKKQEELLRNSLWPCELHMRKQKLHDLLCKIGEEFGMRCHENLKIKFVTLFGEDEEEEFKPYSPTLELDEILLSSCKKRIAPWIVKYLMVPMNQGKIGNRLIFKKLAKKIAHKIVLDDQYPSEEYVKAIIQHYFILNSSIMSIEEIDLSFSNLLCKIKE